MTSFFLWCLKLKPFCHFSAIQCSKFSSLVKRKWWWWKAFHVSKQFTTGTDFPLWATQGWVWCSFLLIISGLWPTDRFNHHYFINIYCWSLLLEFCWFNQKWPWNWWCLVLFKLFKITLVLLFMFSPGLAPSWDQVFIALVIFSPVLSHSCWQV